MFGVQRSRINVTGVLRKVHQVCKNPWDPVRPRDAAALHIMVTKQPSDGGNLLRSVDNIKIPFSCSIRGWMFHRESFDA